MEMKMRSINCRIKDRPPIKRALCLSFPVQISCRLKAVACRCVYCSSVLYILCRVVEKTRGDILLLLLLFLTFTQVRLDHLGYWNTVIGPYPH